MIFRTALAFFLPVLTVVFPILFGFQNCSGGGGGGGAGVKPAGATDELWVASLTGTGDPIQCPIGGDRGEFAESFSFAVTYPESLSADIVAHLGGGSSHTMKGSGSYSGSETVTRQASPAGICELQPTTVSEAPITAETFFTSGMGAPQYRLIVRSEQILVGDKVFFPSPAPGANQDAPCYHLTLVGTTYTATKISGTWRVSGDGSSDGNTASGTFVMNLAGSKGTITGPTGVNVSPKVGKARVSWQAVTGATKYRVRYIQGTTMPTTGFTTIETSATSLEISGLLEDETYTFDVIAVFVAPIESQASVAVTSKTLSTLLIDKIATSRTHTCAILMDRTVKYWDTSGVVTLIPDIANGIDISVGTDFSCAIVGAAPADTSGSTKCWGKGSQGQLGNGVNGDSVSPVVVVGLTQAIQIASHAGHSCAVLSTGHVKCWGDNSSGQLGNNSTANSNLPVAVIRLGPDDYSLTPSTTKGFQVAVGEAHSCARVSTSSGSAGLGVKCWGATNAGELGNGAAFCQVGTICEPKSPNGTPQSVSSMSSASFLAAGGHHSCVILISGGVRCWGAGSSGQLGNGLTNHSNVPVTPTGLSGVNGLSLGGSGFSCASVAGTLKCWGANDAGQFGNGVGVNSATAVTSAAVTASGFDPDTLASGFTATCMKLTDGSAFCFP